MPNVIRVEVDGVDDLLNAGLYGAGAIVRLQSATDEAGPFSNESTAALVVPTRIYTLYDADGTATTWYRTRYENAGATITSDWSDAFQVGGEEAGLICSLYDAKQLLGIPDSTTGSDEELIDIIRGVTVEIESVTGRDFTGDPSSSTWVMHTRCGRRLELPKGVTEVTALAVATTDQPASGGSYTTVPTTEWFLDPPEYEREPYWPATRIVLLSTASALFYDASFGAQLTGRQGWPAVPPNVARIGASAVASRFLTKGKAGPRAVIGPEGRTTILRDISPADRETLLWYAVHRVG